MTACANQAHAGFKVVHKGVYVDWRSKKVVVHHLCEGGHDWYEEAQDEAAVLAKVGLFRIEAGRVE